GEVLRAVTGVAHGQGLRGAKLDDALGRLTNTVTGLAERGLNVNTVGLAGAVSSLTQVKGFEGMHAFRGASRLAQMGPNAAQGMRGGFANLSQMAILAEAAAGGGD